MVGGLGPLASAEFVRTVYRLHVRDREQRAPGLVLYSDPSFPDRTEALLGGAGEELVARLAVAIERLRAAGARRVVIACLTIHAVLPRLPPDLRRAVVSLVDLALDAVAADPRPRLLLATEGTRACGVFEAHPRWPAVARSLVLPNAADQRAVHRWIYRLKTQAPAARLVPWLGSRAAAYRVRGFLFGCTELHLLQPLLGRRRTAWAAGVVDPLRIVAERVPELLAE